MGSFGPTHWLIIALLFLLLFGAKRLPDAARGLGRSLRIFKSEMNEMHSESSQASPAKTDKPAPELPPAQPTTQAAPTNPETHKA
ncbi:Sec-independent protein translocase subunit TatA [Nocardia sp. CDC159]|uniref:Sec-independent protein translocase protein TatA n=1 Tax=Nocardia pulmonis TaxID=2951408 RepID=A0A9X2E745_9NOCA|nr:MULTISPECIES: Sec-independent protein translocase subunit TatA [Nocardia]MCM6775469.1 Sec-independent protein translocase subunit TatA [Nocardia pulmonis]MCM6787797.1 Sec-independent protein translocase subunit TatA [Nocardia sp. CDC159]